MERRALITGVCGFIGSHLAERLVDRGWTVDGIDHHADAGNLARRRGRFLATHPCRSWDRRPAGHRAERAPAATEGCPYEFNRRNRPPRRLVARYVALRARVGLLTAALSAETLAQVAGPRAYAVAFHLAGRLGPAAAVADRSTLLHEHAPHARTATPGGGR